jgi:DNA polymerase I-like protein with 3'-5' exonuclease and polymerase domains
MQQEANGIPCPLGSADKTWRFWGKKANHGLNYDLGYKVFAFLYEIPEKDAKYIVDKYHQAYSGVRKYHDWIKRQLGATRTLTNVLGRKRRFLGQWGDSLFKEAYSYIPQSTVADIINHRGLLYIWKNKDNFFRGLQLINQVHDSIVFQISLDVSWEEHAKMLTLIKQSLEAPLSWNNRSFYIPVDCEQSRRMKPTKKVNLSNSINDITLQLEKNWIMLNEEER